MQRVMQIEIGRQLLSALHERKTALAEKIYPKPVRVIIFPAEQVELER